MLKLSKILLGCTASMTLLVGTAVAASETGTAGAALSLHADTIVTVSLEAMNGGEATGVAKLQDAAESQTALGLEVLGLGADDALVAMIVTGTCEEPGEIRAALGTVESDQEGTARADFALDDALENVLSVPSTIRLQPQGPDAELLLCGQLGQPLVDPFEDTQPAQMPVPEPIPAEGEADAEPDVDEPEPDLDEEAEAEADAEESEANEDEAAEDATDEDAGDEN